MTGCCKVRNFPLWANPTSSKSWLILLNKILIRLQPWVISGKQPPAASAKVPFTHTPHRLLSEQTCLATPLGQLPRPRPILHLSSYYAATRLGLHLGIRSLSCKLFPYRGPEIMQHGGKYYFCIQVGTVCNNSCCWVLFPIYLDSDCSLPPGRNKMDILGGIRGGTGRRVIRAYSSTFSASLCLRKECGISLIILTSPEETQADPRPKW